jgi:hypothetical protein
MLPLARRGPVRQSVIGWAIRTGAAFSRCRHSRLTKFVLLTRVFFVLNPGTQSAFRHSELCKGATRRRRPINAKSETCRDPMRNRWRYGALPCWLQSLAKLHGLFVESRWTGAELSRIAAQESLRPMSARAKGGCELTGRRCCCCQIRLR